VAESLSTVAQAARPLASKTPKGGAFTLLQAVFSKFKETKRSFFAKYARKG